jgi:hypothetical protein
MHKPGSLIRQATQARTQEWPSEVAVIEELIAGSTVTTKKHAKRAGMLAPSAKKWSDESGQ